MQKRFSVAIIGCGSRGAEAYGRLIYEEKNKFCITSICDCDPVKTKKYGDIFEVPEQQRYVDEREFFKERRADVLVLATMDSDHVRQCVRALELGYDILLEKPITNNEEEFFKSDITLQDLPLKEDVTDLFNDTNDPTIFKGEEEVVEEPVIEGTEKDGWFDRILGIKSRKKSKEENAVEDFSLEMPQDEEVNTELSADELDIPAFLRRK